MNIKFFQNLMFFSWSTTVKKEGGALKGALRVRKPEGHKQMSSTDTLENG